MRGAAGRAFFPNPGGPPRPPRLGRAGEPGDGRPGATRVSGRPSRRAEGRTEREPGHSEKVSFVLRPSRARRSEIAKPGCGLHPGPAGAAQTLWLGGPPTRLPESPESPRHPCAVRKVRRGWPAHPGCPDSRVEAQGGGGGLRQGTEVPSRLGPLTRQNPGDPDCRPSAPSLHRGHQQKGRAPLSLFPGRREALVAGLGGFRGQGCKGGLAFLLVLTDGWQSPQRGPPRPLAMRPPPPLAPRLGTCAQPRGRAASAPVTASRAPEPWERLQPSCSDRRPACPGAWLRCDLAGGAHGEARAGAGQLGKGGQPHHPCPCTLAPVSQERGRGGSRVVGVLGVLGAQSWAGVAENGCGWTLRSGLGDQQNPWEWRAGRSPRPPAGQTFQSHSASLSPFPP